MAQAIYGVLAIVMVALLSLTVNNARMQGEKKMIMNEVSTQVTGIGIDVLEHIGRLPFDEEAKEVEDIESEDFDFPFVNSANDLTPESEFGGCEEFSYEYIVCDDIDDYDGLTFVREAGGIPYEVSISVRYVEYDEDDGYVYSGGVRTLAKEVSVQIVNPYLELGGEPLAITMSRVFTYNRHTST